MFQLIIKDKAFAIARFGERLPGGNGQQKLRLNRRQQQRKTNKKPPSIRSLFKNANNFRT